VAGALAGLVLLALAVVIFIQIGNLGLGVGPAVVLLLVAVPLFLLAGIGIRHATGADRAEHKEYPFQLALPSLAYYCAFFLIPLGFLCLFGLMDPAGTSLLFTTVPGQIILLVAAGLTFVAVKWAQAILDVSGRT